MLLNPYRFGQSAPAIPDIPITVVETTPAATGTSHTININGLAGERVVLVITTSSITTPSAPAGWSSIAWQNSGNHTARVFWRDLAADTTSITVTTSGSVGVQAMAFRFGVGVFAAAAPVATMASAGTTATPSAPGIDFGSPGGFARIAAVCYTSAAAVNAYPLPDNQINAGRAASPFAKIAACTEETNQQSRLAASFTLSASAVCLGTSIMQKAA